MTLPTIVGAAQQLPQVKRIDPEGVCFQRAETGDENARTHLAGQTWMILWNVAPAARNRAAVSRAVCNRYCVELAELTVDPQEYQEAAKTRATN